MRESLSSRAPAEELGGVATEPDQPQGLRPREVGGRTQLVPKCDTAGAKPVVFRLK